MSAALSVKPTRCAAVSPGRPGEYREVSYGKGGAYAKTAVGKMGMTHQIAFVHDTLPCYVKINAGFMDEDKTTALVEHVLPKLSDANRPR